MRFLPRLALILIATTCASRAFAAGPHVFDPDGPRPARPVRPAPTAAPHVHAAPAPARPLASAAPRSRMPAPVLRPAPSVNLEPPPPPGMGILRHMMHGAWRGPNALDKRRSARTAHEESYVL